MPISEDNQKKKKKKKKQTNKKNKKTKSKLNPNQNPKAGHPRRWEEENAKPQNHSINHLPSFPSHFLEGQTESKNLNHTLFIFFPLGSFLSHRAP